jgi:hypothetical protein
MNRCRLSQEGKDWLSPRNPDREGFLIGRTTKYARVRWDGHKTISQYATRFIEDDDFIDMRGLLNGCNQEAHDAGA